MSTESTFDFEVFRPFATLFDGEENTVFFVKDIQGRYVFSNRALLRCGHSRNAKAVRGKTPSEIFGTLLGEGYERQDQMVINQQRPIRDLLELHVYPDLTVNWCITNKHPIYDHNRKVAGLVGTSRDLKPADMKMAEFSRLSPVLKYITDHVENLPTVVRLAQQVRLSPYQFDRLIRKVFGMTTGQWLLKQRLDRARRLLTDTRTAIAEIALSTGYSDQSTFTRQFRKTTGLTPIQFRTLATRQG